MDDYRALAVFVAVADKGGFTQAGQHLNLSTSVVSHHVKRLEAHLGTALFFRSTRSMSLTPEGQRMIDPARRMVAARNEAFDALAESGDQPVGSLSVTMPAFGDAGGLRSRVWAFAREYPLISIKLHLTDSRVDIVKEGFDVAIRLGKLAESTLRTRRIGDFHRTLVASPAYLMRQPAIREPEDLSSCEFISFAILPDGITLQKGRRSVDLVPEKKRLEINAVTAVRSAVLAGLGIQRLPTAEVEDDLARGDLVRVLPDWSLPELGVYAVWPDTGTKKKLTKRFVDYLAAR